MAVLAAGLNHVSRPCLRRPAVNGFIYCSCAATLQKASPAVSPQLTWGDLLATRPDLQRQIKT